VRHTNKHRQTDEDRATKKKKSTLYVNIHLYLNINIYIYMKINTMCTPYDPQLAMICEAYTKTQIVHLLLTCFCFSAHISIWKNDLTTSCHLIDSYWVLVPVPVSLPPLRCHCSLPAAEHPSGDLQLLVSSATE